MSGPPGKTFRLNFYWQIIVLLAAGIFSLAIIGSLLAGLVINQRVSNLVYDQAKQITSNFAHQSILPLLSGIGESAASDIEATLSYSNVNSLGIYTPNGTLLIGSAQGRSPLNNISPPKEGAPFEPVLVNESADKWLFMASVYDADMFANSAAGIETLFAEGPQLLGYVAVTIDRSSLFKIQRELLEDNFLISLGIAFALVIIAILITRRIIRPLYRFIGMMEKAETGDDSIRADLTGPVEIDHMARAFNTMMYSLEQRRIYAEDQHNSLLKEIGIRKQIETALRNSESHLKTILSQHEAVVSTIPGVILELDRHGRPLWWNKRVESITGLNKNDLHAMSIIDMVPQDAVSQVLRSIDDGFRLGKCELHTDVITVDGLVPYQFNGVRIDDPSGKAGNSTILAVGMDDSESAAAQKALKEARDAALESSRVKSQFLANMSHEIRTPMNGMLGMLQLIAESNLDAEQKNYVDIALRSADHLLNIINEVLDFSKIEAGKLQLKNSAFAPRALLEDVVELFSSKAHEKGLRIYADISFDIPAMIIADVQRLKQVVSNLVGNAVKFTEEGYVMLRAGINAGKLEISVIDTGIGIEPRFHAKVFESFAQVDGSSTRKYSGTGLGLAIVKQLTELMNGEIELRSTPGRGSEFMVTLPLLETNLQPAEEEITVPGDWHVHYVSDDRLQSSIFEKYASVAGQKYEHISADGLNHIEPGDQFFLFVVDAELFDKFIEKNPWAKERRRNIFIVITHSTTEKLQELAGEFEHVTKLLTPIRFTNFVELLFLSHGATDSQAAHEQAQPQTTHKKPVLVVEDNEINQRVILSMLTKMGYDPILAKNGKEAVDLFNKGQGIDLVFMDCQMPVMDGYQATSEIRRLENKNHRATIIAMTGNAMHGDKERCIVAGMDDYITKPVRLAVLKEMLERLSDKKQV